MRHVPYEEALAAILEYKEDWEDNNLSTGLVGCAMKVIAADFPYSFMIPHQNGVPHSEREADKWCVAEFGGDFFGKKGVVTSATWTSWADGYYFKDETQAMLFKLRWVEA